MGITVEQSALSEREKKSRGTWNIIGDPQGLQVRYQTLTHEEHIEELAESIDNLMNTDQVYKDVHKYIKNNPQYKREEIYGKIKFHDELVSEKDLNEVIDVLKAANRIGINDNRLSQKVK